MESPVKEAALGFAIKYGTTEGQKNDVVFEIQDLKKKTERAASFFPLCTGDECLQHLRDKTHRTMRCGQQDKGETDQKKMSTEADDNEKNKPKLKRASLNHLIVEGTNRDSIRSYVYGIIERVYAKVQEDIRTSEQEQRILASEEKLFNNAHAYATDFYNHSEILDHLSKNQTNLMVKVMQELKEKTILNMNEDYLKENRQPASCATQSIADNHDCKIVSKKPGLTEKEILRLEKSVTEIDIGLETGTEEAKPAQPRLAQYVFLCTTGIPPPEQPFVVIEKKSGWRARLRRFFGCLG